MLNKFIGSSLLFAFSIEIENETSSSEVLLKLNLRWLPFLIKSFECNCNILIPSELLLFSFLEISVLKVSLYLCLFSLLEICLS